MLSWSRERETAFQQRTLVQHTDEPREDFPVPWMRMPPARPNIRRVSHRDAECRHYRRNRDPRESRLNFLTVRLFSQPIW